MCGVVADSCALELSLTVPITNSLAFLFTVLGEWWAEKKVITKGMFSHFRFIWLISVSYVQVSMLTWRIYQIRGLAWLSCSAVLASVCIRRTLEKSLHSISIQ